MTSTSNVKPVRSVKHADFQEELAKIVQIMLEAKAQELKNFSHLVLADVSKFQYKDIRKLIVSDEWGCNRDEWPQEFRLQPVSVPQSEPDMSYDQNLRKWHATYMQTQPPGAESPFVFEDITERLRDSPRFDTTLYLHALLAHPDMERLPALLPALLGSLLIERTRDEAHCMYAIPEDNWLYPCLVLTGGLKSRLSLWRYKPHFSFAYNTTTSSPFAILTVERNTKEGLVKSILHGYIRMKWAYQLAIGEEKIAVKNLCILCLWVPTRGEDEFGNDVHHSWASVLYFGKPASEDETPSIVSINKRFEGRTGKVHLVQLVGLILHRNRWALSKALQEQFSDAAKKMEFCLDLAFQRFNIPTSQYTQHAFSGKRRVSFRDEDEEEDDGDRQRQESGWNLKIPEFKYDRSQIKTTRTISSGRGSANPEGPTTQAPQHGSTIPLTTTMVLVLPCRYVVTGDGVILIRGNTCIKVSPQPVAIEVAEDGSISYTVQEVDSDEGDKRENGNDYKENDDQMEIEKVDDSYTMEIPIWSTLESRFSDIIKRVVDNGQSDLEYGYLDIICDTSHRAWAQIVSKDCANFIRQLQETSVVPQLYHTDDEAVVGRSVIITSYPGDPMDDISLDMDGTMAPKLAIEFLEHMMTLIQRDYLWIELDPDDVFFDMASMQVKLFNIRVSPSRAADCSILHAAGSLLVTFSEYAGGASFILKELGVRLFEETITINGWAMSDSGSVVSVFRDALGFIRSHIALDSRPSTE
ncbi:hypothetical protein PM082_022358 [Marasmius tenuissimus]|nr:hypothetical protein PM082_022358 [Marasmius tenuissimus]